MTTLLACCYTATPIPSLALSLALSLSPSLSPSLSLSYLSHTLSISLTLSLCFLPMRSNRKDERPTAGNIHRTTQARRHSGKNKSFTARNIEAPPPKVWWGAVPGT